MSLTNAINRMMEEKKEDEDLKVKLILTNGNTLTIENPTEFEYESTSRTDNNNKWIIIKSEKYSGMVNENHITNVICPILEKLVPPTISKPAHTGRKNNKKPIIF